ncbi:hypothetical protein B0T19DRAFT_432302 [Cercophora scortea]|uniref:Secreted protein n=1 Tax=Cercophora scortea TaxID=314031 RepID=A0AAE0IB34_9PEZI|nr:hypothetical protein B0T19DRAFT_432302 [Cercophora scortea]
MAWIESLACIKTLCFVCLANKSCLIGSVFPDLILTPSQQAQHSLAGSYVHSISPSHLIHLFLFFCLRRAPEYDRRS